MENYLLAYNFLYCTYLRLAALRDQGFAGISLVKQGFAPAFAQQSY